LRNCGLPLCSVEIDASSIKKYIKNSDSDFKDMSSFENILQHVSLATINTFFLDGDDEIQISRTQPFLPDKLKPAAINRRTKPNVSIVQEDITRAKRFRKVDGN
jgi:hypothetical protein